MISRGDGEESQQVIVMFCQVTVDVMWRNDEYVCIFDAMTKVAHNSRKAKMLTYTQLGV